MSCRRVFANNNNMSYNYYYDKIKPKNKRMKHIYNSCKIDTIKSPINVIDGSISSYLNNHNFSENNCIECINSIDLCNEEICNNPQILYPHGKYKITYYNRCKK